MLGEVAKDITAFMVVLIYCCLAYSFIFFYIIEGEPQKYKDNFYKGFVLALGEFDQDEMQAHWLLWILFAIGAILNLVIMMNLLIAIISETFARVQEGSAVADA